MKTSQNSVLFLGKADDAHTAKAQAFVSENFSSVTTCLGNWGDPMPDSALRWSGDLILSYLSRWIVPPNLIGRAGLAALNFHPASPDYPGIGCINFALYEGAAEYGVTCHHMASRVDTGPIVAVRRFPVLKSDTVATLLSRTYDFQLVLFFEIVSLLIGGRKLPHSDERWTRRPFSRRDFESLRRITPDMSQEEIAKRALATSFESWGPEMELNGFRFVLKQVPADRKP